MSDEKVVNIQVKLKASTARKFRLKTIGENTSMQEVLARAAKKYTLGDKKLKKKAKGKK